MRVYFSFFHTVWELIVMLCIMYTFHKCMFIFSWTQKYLFYTFVKTTSLYSKVFSLLAKWILSYNMFKEILKNVKLDNELWMQSMFFFCLSLANNQSVVTLRNSKAYSNPNINTPIEFMKSYELSKFLFWFIFEKCLSIKGPKLSKQSFWKRTG